MINRKMMQRVLLIVICAGFILTVAWLPRPVAAQGLDQQIRLLILPFQINADSGSAYLATQIPEVIGTQLGRSGATILPIEAVGTMGPTIDLRVRQLAERQTATHIITGVFTLVGNSFTVEANLSVPDQTTPAMIFRTSGRNLENLLSVVTDLSGQLGQQLFRQNIIAGIQIKGNQRIEADAIVRLMQSQVGTVYRPNRLTEDLRNIYNMGYFDDLKIEAQTVPEGKIVILHVKEKATIRLIRFRGNRHYSDDKLKENLTISTGSILNIFKIRSNMEQIIDLYKKDNYHQVKVDYQINPLPNNQADLEFIIEDGSKIYITEINFEGNQAFSDKHLNKEMSTSAKGFFYWLSSSGDLDRAVLDQDVARLNAFYHNNGYIRARIGEPVVDILADEIKVTIKIEEGPQFKVGQIDIAGDLIQPKETLLRLVSIGAGEHFNREKLQQDVVTLTDSYSDVGYAHAEVRPLINENFEQRLVDITYQIDKRLPVYFENIVISGNANTRDKVIRRELRVHEQALFNGQALKRSIRNLYRLDYFEDIKVRTSKGSDDDKMILNIDVKEKPTGTFSFGAGFSSDENLFLLGAISMRNFLGRGQTLQFNGQVGSATTRFSMSFTEPWLFDTRLSASAQVYNQDREYTAYDLQSMGGGLSFGYPIYDYTRLTWGYGYDISEVDNVTDEAPNTIRQLEGTNVTSSVRVGLSYDSRDRIFNPSEGSKHSLNFEYAGLGGDVGFNKAVLDTGWYIPLFKGFVGYVHGKFGVVQKNADDKLLPDYEKFYLGGINSLRGYDSRGVHLTEINDQGEVSEVGGEMMAQFNFEIIIPLYTKLGFMGVVFYDMGNVYDDQIDLGDMRASWGYGIRWYSPIAPIRIEYGHVIDPRDGEEAGRLEFTLGGAF